MCMVDLADDGYWVTLTNKFRKARKQHRCVECARMIEPGETYRYASGVGEYGIDVWHCCEHCYAASSWLVKTCGGFLWEAVGEDLKEHWDESPEYCSMWLGRAIVGMRRQWRRRDGSLMSVLPVFAGRLPHEEGDTP